MVVSRGSPSKDNKNRRRPSFFVVGIPPGRILADNAHFQGINHGSTSESVVEH